MDCKTSSGSIGGVEIVYISAVDPSKDLGDPKRRSTADDARGHLRFDLNYASDNELPHPRLTGMDGDQWA